MKKLLLTLALFAASSAFAQIGNVTLKVYPGVPAGACNNLQQALNAATGDLYSCVSATWLKVGPSATAGNPGGSANQLQYNVGGVSFGGISAFTTNGSTTITPGATAIWNPSAGAQMDFSAIGTSGTFKIPTSATFTASATKMIGFDTAFPHIWNNGADALVVGANASTNTTTDALFVVSANLYAPRAITTSDLPSTIVYKDQTNSFLTTGSIDLSASTVTDAFKAPVVAGFATTSNGSAGFDSTSNNWHFWNGADLIMAPLASGFVSGHCGQPTSVAGKWTIADTGAACASGSGTGTVTHTVGALGANIAAVGNAGSDIETLDQLTNKYVDIPTSAAPANPATGFQRIYASSGTSLLSCLTSGGANCMPAGANTALSNLASVAINATLSPGTDSSIALGDLTHRYTNAWLSGVYGWTNGSGTADTGISRDAAGVIDIGNGTGSDKSGTVQATVFKGVGSNGGLSGTEGTGANAGTAGVGTDILYPDSTNHCWHSSQNNVDVGCMVTGGTTAVTSGDVPKYSSTAPGAIVDSGIVAANITTQTSNGAAGQICTYTGANKVCVPSATPTLGASGTVGTVALGNATSGTVTLGTVTGALGTVTASLPANTGTVAETNFAQTWSALQTFGTNISIGGVTAAGATGTGNVVFATSPALTTPNLGTPSAVTLTNGTGLPLTGLANQAADTFLVNLTTGSAPPTAVAWPTTAHSLLLLEGTGTPPTASGPGTANQVLASGGASADPAYASVADLNHTEYASGGGTAQAQTVTLAPAATALTAGLTVRWLPTAANTAAAPTLAINSLTATAITKCGTTALVANDLTTTAVAIATYDGTQFQLLNPQAAGCGSGGSTTNPQFNTNSSLGTSTGSGLYIPGTSLTAGTVYYQTSSALAPANACNFSAFNVTFTNSSAVIAGTNAFSAGCALTFTTTGTLPTNFATSTTYYVISTGLSTTQFEVSATIGGSAITAGSAGSGTQTANGVQQAPAICIAISTTQCMYNGTYRFSATQSWTAGTVLYLADTSAGGILTTAPTASGRQLQRIGVALAADTIQFMPSIDVGTIQ